MQLVQMYFCSYMQWSHCITFTMLCLYSYLVDRADKLQVKQFAIFHTFCYQILYNNWFFCTFYIFTPTARHLFFVQLGLIHSSSNGSQNVLINKSYLYRDNTERARTWEKRSTVKRRGAIIPSVFKMCR